MGIDFLYKLQLIVNFLSSRFAGDVKRDRSDSSDTDKPSGKKRRLLDSDEETELLKSEDTKATGARIIISDDEEPSSNVRSERPKLSRVIISDEED